MIGIGFFDKSNYLIKLIGKREGYKSFDSIILTGNDCLVGIRGLSRSATCNDLVSVQFLISRMSRLETFMGQNQTIQILAKPNPDWLVSTRLKEDCPEFELLS